LFSLAVLLNELAAVADLIFDLGVGVGVEFVNKAKSESRSKQKQRENLVF